MRKRTESSSVASPAKRRRLHLVEHAGADLGVAEEVHLAVGRNRARLDLADVVQERAPANLDARHGLAHHLLGVPPHVFVPPLAVAEADQRVHLGQERVEGAARQERVEPSLGVFRQEHLVEPGAQIAHHRRGGGAKVFRAHEGQGPVGRPPSRTRDGPVEGIEGAVGVGRQCFFDERHGRGAGFYLAFRPSARGTA
jgi:hypothetical protein